MKTEQLSDPEIDFIRTIPIRFAVQSATIRAKLATGLRYGTAVRNGRFDVVVTAYKIGRNGMPVGSASTRAVHVGLTEAAAIEALNRIADISKP
jgi:hypothetical protein